MTEERALAAAYVTQMQRSHAQKTRGIPTPEQLMAWENEAHAALDAIRADAWDEGAQRVILWNRIYPLITPTDNPYRKETT